MPLDNAGHGAVDLTHRFQWVSPLMFSRIIRMCSYTAGESVFKSTNDGQSWTQISGDLTRNDKSKQQPSGGPLTNDITSVEYYDTVFALAESPVTRERYGQAQMTGLFMLQLMMASIGQK